MVEAPSNALPAAPKITVATVVFNGAASIGRTLESTLAQDCAHVETVVIDGGSTDGTQAVVGRYADAIDCFVSEPDRGIYDAMNKALARASGEFIVFMNCGDVFAGTGALSSAARTLVAGTEQVVFGAWQRREADGRIVDRKPSLAAGLFNHQAIVYSRSIHQRFGPYLAIPGLTTADYLFFASVIASGTVPCRCIDDALAVIDVSGVSAGPQTLSQKLAIDFLVGRASRAKLLLVLAAHPTYRRAKALLRRLR